ncbi:MAG: hypothetical protein ABEJ65_04455 [bacterium]
MSFQQMVILISFLCLPLALFSTPGFAFEMGDRVLGQWADGYWYPATVVHKEQTENNETHYKLIYDDGDQSFVGDTQVVQLDWSKNTNIQCNWQGKGRYYPGTISIKVGQAILVSYDDGDQEFTVIGRCRQQR